MKKFYLFLITSLFIILSHNSFAQKTILEPVGIGEKMGDFTLKTLQGDVLNFSGLKGKNVLMIFPRGKVMQKMWCPICYYQYAEIAEMDKKNKLRKKYNLEILYILPYTKDSIEMWKKSVNIGLGAIEKWKNPDGYDTLTGPVKRWAEYAREFFPDKFVYEDGKMPIPLPILMDEDKAVSKALFLNKEEWGGTKVNQNMPTVFLVDKKGVVQFKYHSQYTNDRPPAKYIIEYLDKMM